MVLVLQAINFCQCGYKMCLWCWNQLMETASREALPGRCPNCRTEVCSKLRARQFNVNYL